MSILEGKTNLQECLNDLITLTKLIDIDQKDLSPNQIIENKIKVVLSTVKSIDAVELTTFIE